MVNWTVTPYLTFAEAQAAQQAIANDVYAEIVPFMEAGRQKFAVVSSGVKQWVQIADLANPLPVSLANNPLTNDLKLRVTNTQYGYEVVEGNIANHTPYSKLSYNPDVDAAEEDMWGYGGMYVFPTGAMGMEVISSNANDTAEGTGARTVKIWYLTTGFAEKTETIILNGTTAVPTAATDIYRINNLRVMTVGSGKTSAGNIDIRHISDIPVYSRIIAGLTRARNSIYTVPVNKTLYIAQISYSAGSSSGGVHCRFTLKAAYDDLTGTLLDFFYPYHEQGVTDAPHNENLVLPLKFISGTDIKVSVQGDATNANAVCTSAYRGWLEVA